MHRLIVHAVQLFLLRKVFAFEGAALLGSPSIHSNANKFSPVSRGIHIIERCSRSHLYLRDRSLVVFMSKYNAETQSRSWESFREEQTRLAIIENVLELDTKATITKTKKTDSNQKGSESLLPLFVVGQTKLLSSKSNELQKQKPSFPCIVLSPSGTVAESISDAKNKPAEDGLVLPLTNRNQLKLISFAKANRRLSKPVLLGLNALLVNRDDGLFDNLPWSTWSVDPQKRNRDAAGNVIDTKYHLGKRDAYNRFMGKDWQGRSLSIGNLALRLKYKLQAEDTTDDENSSDRNKNNNENISLSQRILELQICEQEMDLAEWDYQIAVSRQGGTDESLLSVSSLEDKRKACYDQLNDSQQSLQKLLKEKEQGDLTASFGVGFLISLLDKIADWSTDEGKNSPPYRGAMGYAPMLDTKEDVEGSLLPYTSPYGFMKEILEDQLNAEVIGSILENTSLLNGYTALGGAIILRRITATKSVTIAGEELSIKDEEENFGNEEGRGGEIKLVECDADEAVGMALACGVPLRIERELWERSTLPVQVVSFPSSTNIWEYLPMWKVQESNLSVLVEGDREDGQFSSGSQKTAPVQIPRTTTSLFDSLFESAPSSQASSSSASSSGFFPTDNPIQSLSEYDSLSNSDKARTLLSSSNFDGKLPRPRAIRKYERESSSLKRKPQQTSSSTRTTAVTTSGSHPLDKLLLPLIDESVRREYLIRDAELRGDAELLNELKSSKSKRQIAREKAEQAREAGDEEVADYWESETEFYASLRADVTQDEGSYSRFLDRDEWYERDRLKQAKKLDKKKFGTLLDGIE